MVDGELIDYLDQCASVTFSIELRFLRPLSEYNVQARMYRHAGPAPSVPEILKQCFLRLEYSFLS